MCSHCNGGNYDEPAGDHGQHGEDAGNGAAEELRNAEHRPYLAIEEGRELIARPAIEEAQVNEGLVGQQFIEETNKRVRRNSWAGAKLAIDALRENLQGR